MKNSGLSVVATIMLAVVVMVSSSAVAGGGQQYPNGAEDIVALLDRSDPTDVEAHRGVVLERMTAGRCFR